MVKPHSSNFRVITTNVLGVQKLRIITVCQDTIDQFESPAGMYKYSYLLIFIIVNTCNTSFFVLLFILPSSRIK